MFNMGEETQSKPNGSEKPISIFEESYEDQENSESPVISPTSYDGIVQLPIAPLENNQIIIPINMVEAKIPQQVIAPPADKVTKKKATMKKADSNDSPIPSNETRKKTANDNKKKRLLRNRECARECRRRKKEYIASLEGQV